MSGEENGKMADEMTASGGVLTLPQREPVALIGAVSAALGATLTLVAHWLPMSDQLKTDITGAFGLWCVALVVLVPVIRQAVTPNNKVVARVDTPQGTPVAGDAHPAANGTPVVVSSTAEEVPAVAVEDSVAPVAEAPAVDAPAAVADLAVAEDASVVSSGGEGLTRDQEVI